MTSIRSRCQIAEQAGDELPPADGYSLVQWRNAVPEELIEDVAALQSRLMQWNTVKIHATYSIEEAVSMIDGVEAIF